MRGDSRRELGLFLMVAGLVVWVGLSAAAVQIVLDPGEILPPAFLFEFMGDREARLTGLSQDVIEHRTRLLGGVGMAGLFTVPVLLLGLLGSVLSTRARGSSTAATDREVVGSIHLVGWGLCGLGILLGLFAGAGMLSIYSNCDWVQLQAEFLGRGPAEARGLAITRALDSGLTVCVPFALLGMFVFYVSKRLRREQLALGLRSGAAACSPSVHVR